MKQKASILNKIDIVIDKETKQADSFIESLNKYRARSKAIT